MHVFINGKTGLKLGLYLGHPFPRNVGQISSHVNEFNQFNDMKVTL